MVDVDVLIPTCDRPGPLAVTLTGLVGQAHRPFRVVVSDQTEDGDVARVPEVRAVLAVLRARGHAVEVHKHLPRRGVAEHRHFLLGRARAPYALFLDDDVILEPHVLERLVRALTREGCGFVGAFVDAPTAADSAAPEDEPPPEITIEPWDGPVRPESAWPGTPAYDRHRLHVAAYLHRRSREMGLSPERDCVYKVAWVGGCVLFDTAKLRAVGGFSFWPELPVDHSGEDVMAQLRVLETDGGAGLAPSGAWHQEVRTTTPDREVDAPFVLGPTAD